MDAVWMRSFPCFGLLQTLKTFPQCASGYLLLAICYVDKPHFRHHQLPTLGQPLAQAPTLCNSF